MQAKNRAVIESAIVMARRSGADAVVLAAALPEEEALLRAALETERRVITTTTDEPGHVIQDGDLLALPEVKLRRRGRAKIALLEGLAAGLLRQDERVIVISGNTLDDGYFELDTLAIVELTADTDYLGARVEAPLKTLSTAADPAVFDAVLGLCVKLGHTGREGKSVGLLVTLGDHETVLAHSHPIVLNPFEGHPERLRSVLNPQARRAIREFSGIDGAFIIRGDGTIEAAGRYLHPLAPADAIPSGLGARHRAAAGITGLTRCIAFAVSESTGDTRVFGGGHILMTIEGTD